MKPNAEQSALANNIVSQAARALNSDPYRTAIDEMDLDKDDSVYVDSDGELVSVTRDNKSNTFRIITWPDEPDVLGRDDPDVRKTLKIKTDKEGVVKNVSATISVRDYENGGRKAKQLGDQALTGFMKLTEEKLSIASVEKVKK